jgi:methionyl-tRNA synthetase
MEEFVLKIYSNPAILIPLLVWSMAWKGLALWKCGRHNQLYWFIALLVVNTAGILEIIYIVWFQKKDHGSKK